MEYRQKRKNVFYFLVAGIGAVMVSCTAPTLKEATVVTRPNTSEVCANYTVNRAPLKQLNFIKLPVGSIKPEGWLRKYLELQRDGLTGHLGEISMWLSKENNAWLSEGGDHGWEEVPYWLKGYSSLAYTLGDEKMIAETCHLTDAHAMIFSLSFKINPPICNEHYM